MIFANTEFHIYWIQCFVIIFQIFLVIRIQFIQGLIQNCYIGMVFKLNKKIINFLLSVIQRILFWKRLLALEQLHFFLFLLLFTKLWNAGISHIKILRVIFLPFIHLIIADILPFSFTFPWSWWQCPQIWNMRDHCRIYIRSSVNLLKWLLNEFTINFILNVILFIWDITVWLVNDWRVVHLRNVFIGVLHSLSEGLLIVFLVCIRHACFVVFVLTFLKSIERFPCSCSDCRKLRFPLIWVVLISLSFVLLLLSLLVFLHVSFLKLLLLFLFF